MNILGSFRNLFQRPSLPPRYSDGWQAEVPGLDDTMSGSLAGFAALNRGISIIVGNLVSTPLLVKSGTTELTDTPVNQCLAATPVSHWEAAFYDQIQTGNGWLRIIKTNGVAVRLEHVQAHRMSAQLTPDGEVEYLLDQKPIVYQNFIHLMCRNAYSAYVGEGLVEHHSTSIAMVLATTSIYRQLQSNGSFAEAYISTEKDLTKDQITRLREVYDQQTTNRRAAGGTVILSSGLSPSVIKKLPSALDQDIIKSLDWTIAESARMTGVPLSFLAVKDATAYASSIENGREFLRNTLRPLMVKIEGELSSKLFAKVYFDIGELVLGFGNERADVLSKLTYSGLMSTNEAREALGYGAIPNGDVTGMPSNQVPLHSWIDAGTTQPSEADPIKELAIYRQRKGI